MTKSIAICSIPFQTLAVNQTSCCILRSLYQDSLPILDEWNKVDLGALEIHSTFSIFFLGLELRSCSLSEDSARSTASSRLYVTVDGQRRALGFVSSTQPFCPVRFTSLSLETTFSCEGGDLLLSGLVMDDPFAAVMSSAAPKASPSPAKSSSPPKLSPKVTPKASPKVAPKAAPKTKEVKKDQKADKAVTQRTLPSGLRYEVLQRGSGPQAMSGKKVSWMSFYMLLLSFTDFLCFGSTNCIQWCFVCFFYFVLWSSIHGPHVDWVWESKMWDIHFRPLDFPHPLAISHWC